MSDDSQRPIVVKKIKKGGHGHHGGAWKIAYADFVTAMMAFFLLMWLLGSTTKGNLKGISDYFNNPFKIANSGGSGAGDATSLVPGGGQDLSRQAGQVKKGDIEPTPHRKQFQLQELRKKLEAAMNSSTSAKLAQYKDQLLLDMTAEGLRIQIVDKQNRPMFKSGSAIFEDYSKEILHEIAQLLNDVPNTVSLSGHTDATPFSAGDRGFSNWELSAERANASRRELITGGLNEKKVLRVVGLADAVPYDKDNIYNPINRRISVIVLNEGAEADIRRQAGQQAQAGEAAAIGSQDALQDTLAGKPVEPAAPAPAAPVQPKAEH